MTEPKLWHPRWPRPVTGVMACQSGRSGGVSLGTYESLNLGDHVHDDLELVRENRVRFAAAAGHTLDRVVMPRLEHGVEVRRVDTEDGGRGVLTDRITFPADGLWTTEAGPVLWITIADCVPVFLADLEGRVVGLVHAGWRGVLDGITAVAVQQIARSLEGDTERLVAVLGPSIGACCFEVSEDLGQRFAAAFPDAEGVRDMDPRPHLDLARILRHQLRGLGVLTPDEAPPCTRCESERFFSHRAAGGQPAGRMVAAIWRDPTV